LTLPSSKSKTLSAAAVATSGEGFRSDFEVDAGILLAASLFQPLNRRRGPRVRIHPVRRDVDEVYV
jgi:hypothetical protein